MRPFGASSRAKQPHQLLNKHQPKGPSYLESTNLCLTSEGWYPVAFIEKSKGTRLGSVDLS